MDGNKLTWPEIEKLYDKEWVQLIDYDWPEEEALPRSGIVQVHAKSRQQFDKLITQEFQLDSAILFVGQRTIPSGVILSANLQQSKPTDA